MYKFTLLILVVFLAGSNVLLAQNQFSDSLIQARLKRDVYVLASDSFGGREAGTQSEKLASRYISGQMSQLGLLPKGDSAGSYFSEFRISFPQVRPNTKLAVNDIVFKPGEEFGVTDLSGSGNLTAPMLNIGRGIEGSDYDKYNSDRQSEVFGKIVVIDMDGTKRNDKPTLLRDVIDRVKSAISHGAVGVILHNSFRKSTEDELFGSPFTASLQVPVVYIARLPFNKISRLSSANCTLNVEIDPDVSKPVNVIGWIDNHSSKTVVIGAHYDHLGVKKAKPGTDDIQQVYYGADDNASGTATLLELAHWASTDKSLKCNYIFAAFSAEEKGLFGSKAFCTNPLVNNSSVLYMLNMDMVGRLGCEGDTITALGIASSSVWETMLDTLSHPDFSVRKIYGAPAFSDHSPFLKKGIPVMYFTTGVHPDYHTPKDGAGLINYEGMTELVLYMERFIKTAETLPAIPFHKISALQNTRAYIQTFN